MEYKIRGYSGNNIVMVGKYKKVGCRVQKRSGRAFDLETGDDLDVGFKWALGLFESFGWIC